ncbi:MAG: TonB-dependent receptor [Nitrospira sp.]|nr:TonB-dependent receptor [Nitrospira sp.]
MKKPLTSSLALLLAYTAAWAQNSINSAAEADNNSVVQLSEFVVSAEHAEGYRTTNTTAGSRTNESIRNLPINIQAVSNDFMRDTDALDLMDAVGYVGAISPDFTGLNNNSTNIRGFTSSFQLRNFLRWYAKSDSYNIERVEVLKGPAAVLYTQAFPGGALNLVTKTPQRRDFEKVAARVGSFDSYRGTIDINHDFGTVQARLNAVYSDSGSYLDYAYERIKGIAPTLAVQPTKNTNIVIDFEKTISDRNFQGGISQFQNAIPARGVIAGQIYDLVPFTTRFMGPDSSVLYQVLNTGVRLEHRFTENLSVNLNYNYFLSQRDTFRPFSSAFANIRSDAGGDFFMARWTKAFTSNSFWASQASAVYKFLAGPLKNKLLIGYDRGSDHYKNPTYAEVQPGTTTARQFKHYINANSDLGYQPGGDFILNNNDNSRNDYEGFFGTLQTSTQNEMVRGLLGLRYDSYKTSYLPGSPNFANPLLAKEVDGNKTSPMIGILYTPWSPVTFYALYSEAYTPNSNRRDANNNTLKPQTADGFEYGFKTSALNGRISGSFSVYETDIQNRSEVDPSPPVGSVNAGNAFIASGRDRAKGFDADFIVTPRAGWDITFSYGYVDARVVESVISGAAGRRPTNHAYNSYGVFTRYSVGNGPLKGLYFGGGVRYRGSAVRRYVGASLEESDALTSVNLLVGHVIELSGKKRLRIAANVANLTDEETMVTPNGVPNLAPPRTFSLTMTLSH